jgi:hypothetical protein
MNDAIVIECSDLMLKLLDALVASGCFGQTRDAAAQRLIEQKLFDMSMDVAAIQKAEPAKPLPGLPIRDQMRGAVCEEICRLAGIDYTTYLPEIIDKLIAKGRESGGPANH